MVTPFNANNEIDLSVATALVGTLKAKGTDTIVLSGTTGESPTLTHSEEFTLYQKIVKDHKGTVNIMAGTGSNSTQTAIQSTQEAEACGVDSILQVVPYYNKPSQAGMIAHFSAIAESTSLPIMLYNIPGRTGVNMQPETVKTLSKIKNIVAIKEASGDVEQVRKIRELTDPDFAIYSGDDALTLSFMEAGAVGVVSVASHIVGSEIQEMIRAFDAGKKEDAYAIHTRLLELFSVLFITSNPSPVKAALRMMGIPVGCPRRPLLDVTPEEGAKIQAALRHLNLIA